MNLSYWEYKTWLHNVDFTVVGSGIVGLNCALALKKRFPQSKVLVLEKGILPQGASTKNAGFACFGSISEILSDLETHSEDEVLKLVQKRWEGIQLLRNTLGDEALQYDKNGGHELFLDSKDELYDKCLTNLGRVNQFLEPVFKKEAFVTLPNKFGFDQIKKKYITNSLEGQIDTGKMMAALLQLASKEGVRILNSICVEDFHGNESCVQVKTNVFEFNTRKLIIATNGFASQLLEETVSPARAQVLITKPIKDLHIKGTFHLDEGFYYFRNIDNRVLLGGGRNLDFKAEETYDHGKTALIQDQLEKLLREIILPHTEYGIDLRWSGIMGVGKTKKPIVKQISNNVYCGVRLGGMGVAIGSHIGKEVAELVF